MSSFASLNLSDALMRVLKNLNFTKMTDVQAACIPAVRAGRDLIVQSKTGSGKTAAFVIPALEKIDLAKENPQILILCPTRELCDQVSKECQKFSKYFVNLRTIALIGGQAAQPQINALLRGVHLIIGTPGRTLEHLRNGYIDVTGLKTFIMDEADRLLEEGFAEEMKAIIESLPQDRQTLFFSATFPVGMEELSQRYQKNAERITIKEPENSKWEITQFVYAAEKAEKLETLKKILKKHPSSCTLIFCRTKMAVNEIGKMLKDSGVSSRILHSDLQQADRDSATKMFRDGTIQVLVATDVAARGLDIARLQLVINFDLPPSPDIYIHRIGRTGRAGRNGIAVSIATDYEIPLVAEIEAATGFKMIRQPLHTVIFACVHNAGRSQMAAAFFNQLVDVTKAQAISAGTQPADKVHPEVLEVMKEIGIDLSGVQPQKLTDELAKSGSLLVTMGCGENCPYVPGLEVQDWPFPDPKGKDLNQVRKTRDEIKAKVQNLLESKGWLRLTR